MSKKIAKKQEKTLKCDKRMRKNNKKWAVKGVERKEVKHPEKHVSVGRKSFKKK